MSTYDAGRPMPATRIADARIRYHKFTAHVRQLSLRNTGQVPLWVSLDKKAWFDVAAGTAWDDRAAVQGFWFCTQVGSTIFVVNGLQITCTSDEVPAPTDEELQLDEDEVEVEAATEEAA